MTRECPYTASSRDILGCTSPITSRFPSAFEMSLELRPRDISRASGHLSGLGKSLGRPGCAVRRTSTMSPWTWAGSYKSIAIGLFLVSPQTGWVKARLSDYSGFPDSKILSYWPILRYQHAFQISAIQNIELAWPDNPVKKTQILFVLWLMWLLDYCNGPHCDYCSGPPVIWLLTIAVPSHCDRRTIAMAPHCDRKTIAVACIVTGGPLRTVSCKDSQSLQLSPHRRSSSKSSSSKCRW